MEVSKSNIGTILITASISFLLGMGLMDLIHRNDTTINVDAKPDTTYNKVKLDSIQVQIGKHDTTLYNLKIKLKDDVEKSYQLDDTSAINLFRKLSTDTSSVK